MDKRKTIDQIGTTKLVVTKLEVTTQPPINYPIGTAKTTALIQTKFQIGINSPTSQLDLTPTLLKNPTWTELPPN